MFPSPTMIPEVVPAGLLSAAVETGLVAVTLMVLAGLVGLCLALVVRRSPSGEVVRRASLHPLSRASARAVGAAAKAA